MPTYVVKATPEKIEEMKNYYNRYLKQTPPYAVFQALTPLASITAYQSGKVVFQGKTPEQEAKQWEEETQLTGETEPKKETHAYSPPPDLFQSPHIGSDEAGTGDYFGPITVCALFADKEQIRILKEIGVRDSKHLTDEKIKVLAKRIVEMNIPYRLMRLSNSRYNEWRDKGWSQGKMKALLHHQAVTKLEEDLSPVQPEGVLIDEFAKPDIYKKHIRSEGKHIKKNTYFMTKAESYSIPVAAASILARSLFVKEIDKLSRRFDITVPKGASRKVDRAAAAIIKTHGEDALKQAVKWHFANTSKAKKIAQEG